MEDMEEAERKNLTLRRKHEIEWEEKFAWD